MKRMLVLLAALTAVFALGTASLAGAKAKKVTTMKFTGVVLWTNPILNTIALKGSDDEVRFRIHTTTALKRRGKAVGLAKFEKGDKVTVVYKVERKTKIATAVTN
ncbi:MAG: hypothetical protein L0Z48_12560 [candidate division Zixibacteria bacterium]|nr:hypothetical protein [candidate division Zixibacteria bacterium]MCI0597353.1 hypothetical protein [candidate division Zixibacteria bacterium]